jgi:hypothetical protein
VALEDRSCEFRIVEPWGAAVDVGAKGQEQPLEPRPSLVRLEPPSVGDAEREASAVAQDAPNLRHGTFGVLEGSQREAAESDVKGRITERQPLRPHLDGVDLTQVARYRLLPQPPQHRLGEVYPNTEASGARVDRCRKDGGSSPGRDIEASFASENPGDVGDPLAEVLEEWWTNATIVGSGAIEDVHDGSSSARRGTSPYAKLRSQSRSAPGKWIVHETPTEPAAPHPVSSLLLQVSWPHDAYIGVVHDSGVVISSKDQAEHVYQTEHEKLWRSLVGFSGSRELADDAVSEAFAQLIVRGDNVRNAQAWVWKAAFQIAAGELQRRGRAVPLESERSYDMPEPLLDVLRALTHLGPKQRLAVVLHDYADRPTQEVAGSSG